MRDTRIHIKSTERSLQDLKDYMDKSKRVYYVRYGDNDIYQMVGSDGRGKKIQRPQGGNRTEWTPELQRDLLSGFKIVHNHYMRALTFYWQLEPGMKGTAFDSWKSRYLYPYIRTLTKQKSFYHPVLFHYLACFKPREYQAFRRDYIKPKKKIFIGSNQVHHMEPYLGPIAYHVNTPEKNAPAETKRVWKKTVKALELEPDTEMIILACGQLSRVLAGKLWRAGIEAHVIDIGSSIDAYAGKISRQYLKEFSETIKKYG